MHDITGVDKKNYSQDENVFYFASNCEYNCSHAAYVCCLLKTAKEESTSELRYSTEWNW